MSYDPVTRTRSCDVCGSKVLDGPYYTYRLIRKNRVLHICLACIDHGAYWCPGCEDVHAGPDQCPQQQIPWYL